MATKQSDPELPTFEDPMLPAEIYISREFNTDDEDSYLLTHDTLDGAPDQGEVVGVYKLVRTGSIERKSSIKFSTTRKKKR